MQANQSLRAHLEAHIFTSSTWSQWQEAKDAVKMNASSIGMLRVDGYSPESVAIRSQ